MVYANEEAVLERYLAQKGLKRSQQRLEVLRVFLGTEEHLTPEELHLLVKREFPEIGIATVYRTLKVLCDCSLARELTFDGKTSRYEHLFGHDHHDHLICRMCGAIQEVVDPEIERLQEQLARKHHFTPEHHRMEIFGLCKRCKQ